MTSLITNIYDNIGILSGIVAFGTVTYYGIKYMTSTSSSASVDTVAQNKIDRLTKRMHNDQIEIFQSRGQISELKQDVIEQKKIIDHLVNENINYQNQINDLRNIITEAKNDPSILNNVDVTNTIDIQNTLLSLDVVERMPDLMLPDIIIGEVLRNMSSYQITWLLAGLMVLGAEKTVLKLLIDSFNRIRKDKDKNILKKYFSSRIY